ncbi:hypothetical protein CBR_g59045 [Chara braunii]|uniref:Uncharacterized protein n=1 Tax=Chara braunii TaxID=69332 RepID=A0A388MEY2_CHABU|nr:hypothetical protein CBR_g59045 [Chara braunii]|eukprot:GBG93111.1 hypothetical protein CBR_g59045 [Chara braunii]
MQFVAGSSSVSSAAARGGGVMQAPVGSISRQVDGYAPVRGCAPFTGRCQLRCQWLEQWGMSTGISGRWAAPRRRQRSAEDDWFCASVRRSAPSRSVSRGCLRSGLSRSGRCTAVPSSAKWRSNRRSCYCEVLRATSYHWRERAMDFDCRRFEGGRMFLGMPRGLFSFPEDSRLMGPGGCARGGFTWHSKEVGSFSSRDGGTRRLCTWRVHGQERSDLMGEGGDDDEYVEDREGERRGRASGGSERGEETRKVEERTDARKAGGGVGAAASGASDGQTQGAGGGRPADVKWSARLGGWLGGKGILARKAGEGGVWGGLKKAEGEESLAPVAVNMETDADRPREGGGEGDVEGVGAVSSPHADVAATDWLAEDEAEGLLAEGKKSVNGYRGWSSFVLLDNDTSSSSSSLLSAGGGGGGQGGDGGGKGVVSVQSKEIISKGKA